VWLDEIARSYFDPKHRERSAASVMIEGVAQGMAWLIAEATLGKRFRGSSRVARAHARGDFGPGNDVHSALAEGIANAAFRLGRDWVRTELGEVDAAIASQVIAAAAAAAIEDVYASSGDRGSVRRLFLIEIEERLDAKEPWLGASIRSGHQGDPRGGAGLGPSETRGF
jgi:hypothetical protein